MSPEFVKIKGEEPLRLKTSTGVLYELRPQALSYRKVTYDFISRSEEARFECEVYRSHDSGNSWKHIPWQINWWPHRLNVFSDMNPARTYWPPTTTNIEGVAIIKDELIIEYLPSNTYGTSIELIYWITYNEEKMRWTIELNRAD